MDIITSTIESLLRGEALDRDTWLHLATMLGEGPRSEDEDALFAVAQMVTTEDVGSLDALLKTIPEAYTPLRALGEAVAASRSVNETDPKSLSDLVYARHGLVPYLRDRDHVKAAFEALAAIQARVIEMSGASLDPGAATMFANLANTLAMSLENPAYLEAALAMGDRLHLCASELGRFMVTSNLVTTCKQLAKYKPSEAERYLLRGVELASSLFDGRREFAKVSPDAAHARRFVAQALGNLLFMHTELFAINPARSAEHAAAAHRQVSRMLELAIELDDPDLRVEAAKAEKFVLERVGPLPGSQPVEEAFAVGSTQEASDRIDVACQASWAAAQRALDLSAEADRKQAIEEHVAALYNDLAEALKPAVEELGINCHVSRLFLALGAAASGRLWPISLPAVHACVLYGPELEEGTSHAHNVARSQQVPSLRMFDVERSYVALLCAVAVFSDGLSFDSEAAGILRGVLRRHNRSLLERVLPAAKPQIIAERSMPRMFDLAQIMTLVQFFGGEPGRAEASPP